MSDWAEVLIRAARAANAARTAAEYEVAVNEGHDLPAHAARHHWDASALLRQVGQSFLDQADQHGFAARRYERAQMVEDAGGPEFRGGPAAA